MIRRIKHPSLGRVTQHTIDAHEAAGERRHLWTFDGGTASVDSGKIIHRQRCTCCGMTRRVYSDTGRVYSR